MNSNSHKSDILSNIQKLNKKDLIIFLIPLIIFILYLYVYNPGILTMDSFSQLHQIATNEFNNHHPFFHTFIEMLCMKIYASPIAVGVFQILVFSSMWMIICKYHRDDTVKSHVFILQAIVTLIICLIPINAIYSITLWKDILFSYFLMFLCFLIKVMIDKGGKVDYKFIILMSLTMAFVSQLRLNGIYVIIATLIILTIYLFMKDRSKKMYILLPALTIVLILLIMSLNVVYDVDDNQKDYVFVKTTHMLADYDLHLDLEKSDRDKIHKLIKESKINKTYSIYNSDPISWHANKKVFDKNKDDYIGMAMKYSLNNPMRCLFYLFKSADIVWDITRDSDWTGEVYYINSNGANLEAAKEKYFKSINSTPNGSLEDLTSANVGRWDYKLLNSFVNQARKNIIMDTIFNSPALYMYLAILPLALMQILTKSKEFYLVYLPNFMNILVVFASIPVQDNRYLYANLLVFYLLVIISIGLIFKQKGRPAIQNMPKRNEDTYQKAIYSNEMDDLYSQKVNSILNQPPQRKETPEEMEARIRAKVLRELEMEKRKKK